MPRDGLRILLIEDHASTRHDVSHILRSEDAIVREAADGATGLQAARSWRSAVLLDVMPPDTSDRPDRP